MRDDDWNDRECEARTGNMPTDGRQARIEGVKILEAMATAVEGLTNCKTSYRKLLLSIKDVVDSMSRRKWKVNKKTCFD